MSLHRPAPVHAPDAAPIRERTPQPARAAARLRGGEVLRVADHYRTGLAVLEVLRGQLPPPQAPFAEREAADRAHAEVAARLLVPISGHRVALAGAPEPSGFLAELYPEQGDFLLPLPAAQDLHRAWRRYADGVYFAVLGHPVHPFYGTYVPTRTSHLELFATWLSQHRPPVRRAADVGTGCGVLARMLSRAGCPAVLATDISPNAVESVARDLRRRPAPVTPRCGDLLEGHDGPFDLIVFNPPWIPGAVRSPLDRALFFDDDLFARFFSQAAARLAPDGRIVLLFSDVMSLLLPGAVHPIRAELERGRLREVRVMRRRVRPPRGSQRRTRERVEVWELALA